MVKCAEAQLRIRKKSLVGPLHRPRVQIRAFVGRTESSLHRVDPGGARESIGVVQDPGSTLAQINLALRQEEVFKASWLTICQTTHGQIDGIRIRGRSCKLRWASAFTSST